MTKVWMSLARKYFSKVHGRNFPVLSSEPRALPCWASWYLCLLIFNHYGLSSWSDWRSAYWIRRYVIPIVTLSVCALDEQLHHWERRICVQRSVIAFVSCAHDILTSALSKRFLCMLTDDICKSTHSLFLIIFYGDECLVQIHNKAAAHVGLARSVERSKRNRPMSGITCLEVRTR